MLAGSPVLQGMFGAGQALVSAIKLTELPGVNIEETPKDTTYIHLLFDQHEVIFANAAPTESLFLGEQALGSVGARARAEILMIFPELGRQGFAPLPAAPILSNKDQKALVSQHRDSKSPISNLA